ncbi:MAG: CRISPR-associated protein Cas5 [Candidatus Hydrogenedentes bacterium]|nr:CRISPR-associated protein Cas5 [Candidatus Hydrogenedentota bacterium]
MISVYVEAPFAAFRTFVTGYFRPTAGFMTYSAAYGLLMNLAGIEMRHDDGTSVMTLIKADTLPACRIALGTTTLPQVQSVYQQLHNYPVGSSGKDGAERTKGGKYNIVPVRRELLCGLQAWIQAECPEEVETALKENISGKSKERYGLPFLGDNNFLPNRIECEKPPGETRWWRRLAPEETNEGLRREVTRLTISIDRADMTRSRSDLFLLEERASDAPPAEAWVEVAY